MVVRSVVWRFGRVAELVRACVDAVRATDSEVSLSKGFGRGFGISPGRYRSRTLGACPADPLIILV